MRGWWKGLAPPGLCKGAIAIAESNEQQWYSRISNCSLSSVPVLVLVVVGENVQNGVLKAKYITVDLG